MGKRFGRNQKRKLKDIIRELKEVVFGRAVYQSLVVDKTRYSQGYFVDQPQYKKWSEEEKERANDRESHLVRPSPTGNAICHCPDPKTAQWITSRLNKITDVEEIEKKAYNQALEDFSDRCCARGMRGFATNDFHKDMIK